MATTTVDICNMALSKIGELPIINVNDDEKTARLCNLFYQSICDYVLRENNWNCAIAREELGQLSSTPAYGYDYEYQLPIDCLKVLEMYPDAEYKIEGRKLLTDQESVHIKYIKRLSTPANMDFHLVQAIATRLAAAIVKDITGSTSEKGNLLVEYQEWINDAVLSNAIEHEDREKGSTLWIDEGIG